MCGISGIISKSNKPVQKDQIKKMNDLITHRGPDGFGYYFGDNFALGHRRLSIIDLSDDGRQPMAFDDRYVIIYNGEIYNYLDLKKELSEYNYTYKSQTDTEVILAAYDRWGEECVKHFNGMWSFAIYDRDRNTIFCSRDRFGIKPFYYTEFNNKFMFGSEIKQFTVLDGWKAKANRYRVVDFLMFEMFDYSRETLFEGVYQLKGGHNLIYDLNNHTYKTYQYYSLHDRIEKSKMTISSASKQFYEVFEDSVTLRLRSDVKVGSCLSGGLDSSSIVCVANNLLRQKDADNKQETVSSCFDIKKCDEQQYIDCVAEKTGIATHKVFPKFGELFEVLDKITWHQDEPFGSTSIFAQWSVFKAARENCITVMLDGQGADEQLAGYNGFYGIYLSELIRKFKFVRFFKEVNALRKIFGYSLSWIVKSTGKFLIPNSLKAFIKTKISAGIADWVNIDEEYYRQYLDTLYGPDIKDLKEYSLNQVLYTSLPKLLHYEDRDSMAHSIESRVPFLDYRLVEFVLSLPPEHKINGGITKAVMRHAMKGILPDKIRDRADKLGFVTPEDIWIRENREKFRDEIQSACGYLEGIVDRSKTLKWFDNLIDSNRPIDFTIWRVISLGHWMKVFEVKL